MGLIRILSTHIFLSILGLSLAFAQDDYWVKHCNAVKDATRYAKGNVVRVLTHLSSKTTNGFANFSSGEGLDTVNGIAFCRADIESSNCVACLNDARRRLMDDCHNKMEAIGWYDKCMLRYSNRTIFNTMEVLPDKPLCKEENNPTDRNQFMKLLLPFLQRIETKAVAAGAGVGGGLGKFATGKANITIGLGNLTLYGLVMCTPDISGSRCRYCLDSAINSTHKYCYGRLRARIYKPSCVIWYENHKFYNEESRADPPSDYLVAPAPSVELSPLVAVVPPLVAVVPPLVSVVPPPEFQTGPRGNNRKKIVLVVAPTLAAVAVILVLWVYSKHLVKRKQKDENFLQHGTEAPTSFVGSSSSRLQSDEDESGEMHLFNLKTIREATNNFSIENKLGQGGFGPVFKGNLNDGKEVAVKRLSKNSGQGLKEFKTEVKLIVKLQHKNLVRLLGCCTQKFEKLLVYEFMPNTSLDTFLFDQAKCKELDWPMRANIVGGIAKGLRYLHEDSRLKIIHRDMKASNVLLDNDMNAKISDFGTARIFGGNQTEDNTNRIVGTYGYMAPEYAMEGVFSTKSDVYSFGVLLLEIISGQKISEFYRQELRENLLSYAWRMWKEGTTEKLIDENITESCLVSEALRWTNIALLCVQEDPNDRPAMSSVVFMLEGQLPSLPQPSEPPFSAVRLVISDQSSSTGGAGAGLFASNQSLTTDSNTS